MSNKVLACKDCPYNIPKTKGGFGRLCNGSTQETSERCPEWRIAELKENYENNYEILKTLACPPWERALMVK